MADRYLDIGVAGANSGTLADPWTDWQSAFTGLSAGDVIYFKGNATIGTKLTMTGIASATTPTSFIACDSSWVPTESTYYISGGASITSIMQITSCTNFLWKGIVFKSTTSFLIETGYNLTNANHVFVNCGFDSGTTIVGLRNDQVDNWKFINCYALNLSASVINIYATFMYWANFKIINCGNCISAPDIGGFTVERCLIHSSASITTALNIRGFVLTNSVIDGLTGVAILVNIGGVYAYNKFTNCSGTAVFSIPDYLKSCNYRYNYFYNNTDDILAGTPAHEPTLVDLGGNLLSGVTSTDDYVDKASDDFSPAGAVPAFEINIGNEGDVNSSYENYAWSTEPTPDPIVITDIDPASGESGDTVTITGTGFTGTGNIVKLGGSGGTSCTVTSESTTSIEFTVPAVSAGDYDVYIENSDGLNIVVPNGFEYSSATAPVFAGITNFEILSNNKFFVEWSAGTGTITSYDIYIRNATNPFSSTYLVMKVKPTVTKTIVHLQGDAITFLQGGTKYYCGVRADNCGTDDGNTVELSNRCSGAELVQRMTVTQPIISL